MSKHWFQEFSEQARSRGQALRQNTELEELVILNKPKKFPVGFPNADRKVSITEIYRTHIAVLCYHLSNGIYGVHFELFISEKRVKIRQVQNNAYLP